MYIDVTYHSTQPTLHNNNNKIIIWIFSYSLTTRVTLTSDNAVH